MINCWLPPWVREGNPGSHTAAHSRDYGCQEEVRHIHCAFIDFIEYRLHKIFFHVQIQVMEGGSLGEITPWQIFSWFWTLFDSPSSISSLLKRQYKMVIFCWSIELSSFDNRSADSTVVHRFMLPQHFAFVIRKPLLLRKKWGVWPYQPASRVRHTLFWWYTRYCRFSARWYRETDSAARPTDQQEERP